MHCRPSADIMLSPLDVLLKLIATGVFKPADMPALHIGLDHGVSEVMADHNIHQSIPCDIHGHHSHRGI